MLLVRCQQGMVAWLFERTGDDAAHAVCLLDMHVTPFSQHAAVSWITSLTDVEQHSVSLRGAIQWIVYLPHNI